MTPAWLISVGFTALAVYGASNGLIDRHTWDTEIPKFEDDALVSRNSYKQQAFV